jgi:pilus assembly protein CpaF
MSVLDTSADHFRAVLQHVREELSADPSVQVGELPARIATLARAHAPLLDAQEFGSLSRRITADLTGLGVLEPLLADPMVSDVLVHGDGQVWVERSGRLECLATRMAAGEVERVVERILAPLGRRLDRTSPIVDARLADGSRLHAIVPPVAVDGPCVAIRRFGSRPVPLAAFTHERWAALLAESVRLRRSMIVSGGTGAGKTTLVNALAGEIPHHERVVTIEDAAELRLALPHVVRLEARPPSADGVGEVTVRTLVRAALRLRPDRIVVGEVRGGEALDMTQAMHTGHAGSMSTVHANSAIDALRRLEVLVLWAESGLPLAAVREHIATAIDLVVHVERDAGGQRQIVQVAEVGLLDGAWSVTPWT